MSTSMIKTDHTMKELTEHGTAEYPILISCGLTLSFDTGIVSWHWHDDFELTYVESGHLNFSVGSDSFLLNPGEAVFINAKILHQVKPLKNESPVYYSYAFAPELISESMQSLIATKYIIPLMHNGNFPYNIFHEDILWEKMCLATIHALNQTASAPSFTQELMTQHYLQAIFIGMIQNKPEICTESAYPDNRDSHSIMKIMLFIKKHYPEVISLSDLANEAIISKSSCNRLFHKTLRMTPFEYLLDYRLNQSKELLKHSTQSITEISYSCGFHDISYYCKIFGRYNGISPYKYRLNKAEARNGS